MVTQMQTQRMPILCVNVCIAIDTMLNFYSDAKANINCEQAFN